MWIEKFFFLILVRKRFRFIYIEIFIFIFFPTDVVYFDSSSLSNFCSYFFVDILYIVFVTFLNRSRIYWIVYVCFCRFILDYKVYQYYSVLLLVFMEFTVHSERIVLVTVDNIISRWLLYWNKFFSLSNHRFVKNYSISCSIHISISFFLYIFLFF